MKLRYKITWGVLALIAIGVVSLALALSHDSPCRAPAPTGNATTKTMKAIVHRCYGSPDVLRLEDVPMAEIADNEVRIRVRAAALNPLDWHTLRGKPYVMRADSGLGAPKRPRLGVDFAGTIETVGSNVTRFKPGDEVFGAAGGAFAQYLRMPENGALVRKPGNVTFEQAASVPVAALTALQALRDRGRVQPGQKVLINGASGGVGTFAVQLAKIFGAEVTGVCSTRNVQMVGSLGADHVIDYTREDFTTRAERYDLIIDNVGSHSLTDYRRVLNPKGALVIIGGPSDGAWLGPLSGALKAIVVSPFVSQQVGMMIAQLSTKDLEFLRDLIEKGKITPVIDRRYPLSQVPEALAYLEAGHARGKVVIDVE